MLYSVFPETQYYQRMDKKTTGFKVWFSNYAHIVWKWVMNSDAENVQKMLRDNVFVTDIDFVVYRVINDFMQVWVFI